MPNQSHNHTASLIESFTNFGDLLKYLRRRARLTQSELAIAVGYSREQITRLENNQRLPDLSVIKALFMPTLDLDDRPDLAEQLLQLATAARASMAEQSHAPAPLAATTRPARTNLRLPLTSLVGRQQELAELQRLLATARLLTLVGTGGVGKSRLALQVGSAAQAQFADGVWWVELAALGDPALVPQAVALALGLAPAPTLMLQSILLDYLRDKQLLLILDNCEHLLAACITLVELVLQEAPGVHILTTSRESLEILSAITWQVPPLSLPAPLSPAIPPSAQLLHESEAVRLFVERATAAKPSFTLEPRNAAAVAELCVRLDGLPLAIELAATRVRMMSAREMVERLGDRFRLLAGGNSTARTRHQTLRALIDWSYDLLSDQERALLCQLSIFAGGWTLEAAEWISESQVALDLLTQLVNKSLVVVDERDDATRYRLLETIGDYAREKLALAGHEHHARVRQLEYYIAQLEQARPHLAGLYHNAWNAWIEGEQDNLRAALAWATQQATSLALRLIVGLWYFWLWNGYWSEGLAWVSGTLAATSGERSAERAWGLIGGALLAGRNGDYQQYQTWLAEGSALAESLEEPEAIAWARIGQGVFTTAYQQAALALQESSELARMIQNDWLAGMALFVLGERARSAGETERATACYSASRALFHAAGDLLMIAWPIGNLGRLALERGDYAQAQSAFAESVALCRAVGHTFGAADWLMQVVTAALHQQEYQRAQIVLGECLLHYRAIGNIGGVANCLVIAAGIAAGQTQWERAAILLAAVEPLLERFRVLYHVVDTGSYAAYTRQLAAVQAQLDQQALAATWQIGGAMASAQAIAYALGA